MTDEAEQAAADFVATLGGNLAAQGFPRIPAFVIMALTVSEEGRLTAAELGDQLGVSPAAISGAIRYLTVLRFVQTATMPGSRRHVYSLSATPWYAAALDSSDRYRQLTRITRDAAAGITGRPRARARIEELAAFWEFLERRMPELLDEWSRERPRS